MISITRQCAKVTKTDNLRLGRYDGLGNMLRSSCRWLSVHKDQDNVTYHHHNFRHVGYSEDLDAVQLSWTNQSRPPNVKHWAGWEV